jgi:excisionase family DNA binding protein
MEARTYIDDEDYFVPVRDIARMLGVAPLTVRRLSWQGKLPIFVKVGKLSCLPISEVRAYMETLKAQRQRTPWPESLAKSDGRSSAQRAARRLARLCVNP